MASSNFVTWLQQQWVEMEYEVFQICYILDITCVRMYTFKHSGLKMEKSASIVMYVRTSDYLKG